MNREGRKWLAKRRLCGHCIILYASVLLLILPPLCFKLTHSKYFISTTGLVERQLNSAANTDRLSAAAIQQLQRQQKVNERKISSECTLRNDTDMAVAVITKKRSVFMNGTTYSPRYLTRVINALFNAVDHAKKTLGDLSFCSPPVVICNANTESVDEVNDLSPFVRVHELKSKRYTSTIQQESQDYKNCLEHLLRTYDSNYYIILEDDALPHENMFYVLHRLLHEIMTRHLHHEEFFYLKLFHPDKLADYLRNPMVYQIVEWCGVGIMFGFFTTLLYVYLLKKNVTKGMIVATFFLTGLLAMLTVELIGRLYFLELRRLHWQLYSIVPAPGCCTPAMLYTRESMTIISSLLHSAELSREPVDFILYNYALQHSEPIWLIEPSLVTHIGMVSAVRHRVLDPYIV